MICKLKGEIKDYIWGGTKLVQHWNKSTNKAVVAESWEVSTHIDGVSIITHCDNKLFVGKKLSEVLTSADISSNHDFDMQKGLPLLIKLIDAKSDLSVQVHPDDEYASNFENDNGKTEMWYIADCDNDAKLYIGFKQKLTKSQLTEHIKNNTLQEVLQEHHVKVGQSYFIPAGTVHAIGKGNVILEIQQSSNLTYRMYDYGRVDSEGNKRPLHLEKAMQVAVLDTYANQQCTKLPNGTKLLAKCKYFTVYECVGGGTIRQNKNSFSSVTFLDGKGTIGGLPYQKGDSFFISANSADTAIDGNPKYILTQI